MFQYSISIDTKFHVAKGKGSAHILVLEHLTLVTRLTALFRAITVLSIHTLVDHIPYHYVIDYGLVTTPLPIAISICGY